MTATDRDLILLLADIELAPTDRQRAILREELRRKVGEIREKDRQEEEAAAEYVRKWDADFRAAVQVRMDAQHVSRRQNAEQAAKTSTKDLLREALFNSEDKCECGQRSIYECAYMPTRHCGKWDVT